MTRIARSFLFLASALVTGTLAFGLILAGLLAVGLLSVTPLVVPALLAYRSGIAALARLEASLARSLLGVQVEVAPFTSGGTGFWGRGGAVVRDPRFWREQAYLATRLVVGWPLAVGLLSLLGSSLWFIALPVYYRWVNAHIGALHVNTFGKAALLIPVGVVGLAVTAGVTLALGALWRRIASRFLNAGGLPSRRSALRVHGMAAAVANAVVLIVWAAVGGPFWPSWVLISTGLLFALHAWVSQRRTPLADHAGASVAISVALVLMWVAAGGGYFWPVWPVGALALVLGVHALVAPRREALQHRIATLETTRAGAVDVQETELRRIERDLHDGAQARLVALGMNLGMAEQKLALDPEAARDLVTEARLGVEEALRELRDLARGIHPPVLADRGLEAAISALAQRSAVPVAVTADVPERPPAAVETAAYFVAAEALANAAKHADATRIKVRLVRDGARLVVEVADDGRGGANGDGSGLRGLRQRVEALDGTLSVVSPSGAGTTLRAELPCAS